MANALMINNLQIITIALYLRYYNNKFSTLAALTLNSRDLR